VSRGKQKGSQPRIWKNTYQPGKKRSAGLENDMRVRKLSVQVYRDSKWRGGGQGQRGRRI